MKTRSRSAVEFGAARARIGAHFEVFVDRHARKQPARLQHRGDAAAHPLGDADPGSDLPSNRTSPRLGTTTPMIAFIVVDLPEALPPSRHTISPCLDPVIDRFQHVQVAVMGVDPAEFEERRQAIAALRPR